MKTKALFSVLVLSALFIFGARFSLEARHHHNHFGLQFGTSVDRPASYVIEQRPRYYSPERVYVRPNYYPVRERVYCAPEPYYEEVYVYPPAPVVPVVPVVRQQFSIGWNFFR